MAIRVGCVVWVLMACRAEPELEAWDDPGPPNAASDGGASAAPEKPDGAAAKASGASPGAPSNDAAGAPAADPSLDGCGAQAVTLEQIHGGRVRAGVRVSVGPLVASSQKFLVSEAKSGSCLWGAFAAARQRSGAGSGLFLVSFGEPHADGEACAPGTDGLPDDLAPGDNLQATGKLADYAPASCDGVAAAQQLVLDAACPLGRDGTAAAPEPALIDTSLADRLATGSDAELLRQWGGALVRLDGVSARPDEDGDAVFPFGVVQLAESALEVHSRLYYFDLNEGGPRSASKAPRYPYPTAFESVTGVVFLDYCSWVLAPRDRCTDLAPASGGCRASAAGP